ncbi:small acid-soluble spore, H-type family protein [Clostridium argentinense CDC 2741]|uniref:Small acid-soluble spore, H-type family protein n=1 Tax=Clostridium argentinense CDC 2741 TaxID=1418104 RepID=A0A0C1U0R9_9CLOT|nr:H-type small acid-soluble spore protein [Clostridium argentinense]ARC86091.1 H-type small acid-soluble spore protein [Clostridium argentinense]KIE46429.1 small acid-soluble spore, H-type family protein [Clostridium argentinense CDC 2741]NFF39032.1 H-type small acid-soluble spore protein [Clostridium argentinense]NFP48824.1 H-type small acid-soluble spore protein [Clostridium argentinense]NFP70908.1 H-type small acid-soluble spore protein [Clostridium argentinense]
MDLHRVMEIKQSLGVINVSYNGNLVWLETVNKANNKVLVKDLNNNNEFMVNVSDLKEV